MLGPFVRYGLLNMKLCNVRLCEDPYSLANISSIVRYGLLNMKLRNVRLCEDPFSSQYLKYQGSSHL